MLNGLYKVEIDGARGSGRGVMVVRDGHLFGGNAAFALAGRCLESGQELAVDITTVQRNDGLGFKPVAGVGRVALRGRREGGNRYLFEGGTALLAGAPFTVVMTAISEEAAPPAIPVSWYCTMAPFAAAMPISTMSVPTAAPRVGGRAS
jgi:hypothetical protein